MQFIRECISNDKKLIRSIVRPWFYRMMRFQYYELTPIRVKMMNHCYMDKEEMLKQAAKKDSAEGQQGRQWKWVFHVKEERPRMYSRFWKVDRSTHQSQ